MKPIYFILGIIIFLKMSSCTIAEVLKFQSKEISKFYFLERYRKYLDHSYDFSTLVNATIQNKSVPPYIRQGLKDLNSPDEKSDNFNRTWFQDFFKFLNNNVPLTNLKQINDINVFPDSLKNAVLEEHAKNEIYNLYEEKKWLKWEYNHKVKGIIKNISTGHGTLLIDIIPFSYSSHDFIDECKRGSEIISIKSNPFYYTDSLNNWTCTKLNPVTGEILKFEFE